MCKSTVPACEDKMDEDTRKDKFKSKGNGNSLMSTNGFLFDPWHSTPVKKHKDEASMARQPAKGTSDNSADQQFSLSDMQRSRTHVSDLEITTIQKQRMELQLLIAELKDRDQELNSMAAAHHRQLQAWEQDRQRVLTLEQRCARLEDELQKRNEVIRAISKRLKMAEVREQDSRRELSSIQQRMLELSQRQQHSSQQHQDLEEKNRSLNSSILSLSSQLGQLQVHEEELSSMLRLKDKDLTEATNHILSLTDQLRESKSSLTESQTHESKMLLETEEYKRHLREARHQKAQIKDELQEKTLENNTQREELIRLRQENQLLRKELVLADESESWKEELLALARSKQERTESELLCLRQVCEHQQNDLQLLKLNLETTREALMQYENQRSLASEECVAGASCALEHRNHQETAIGECHSKSLVVPEQRENHRITATTSGDHSSVQNIICDVERQVRSCKSPARGSDGPSAEKASTLCHCSECSNGPAESKAVACCSSGTEVDLAVINHSAVMEDRMLLVDVNPNKPRSSCPGDVTCVYVDCSTPSPRRRTLSPGLVEDGELSKQQQETFTSSTCRLQRLLAESQQMVASLELSSGKPLSHSQSPPNHSSSPVLSSTSQCNSVCSLSDGHNNTESRNQFQTPNNSQEERQPRRDGSQIHSMSSSQKTKGHGQQISE